MKQTAVQWLVNEIFAGKTSAWQKEIEQALKMEKEQKILSLIELPNDEEILKAAKECVYEDLNISVGSFELGAKWHREQLKNQQQ